MTKPKLPKEKTKWRSFRMRQSDSDRQELHELSEHYNATYAQTIRLGLRCLRLHQHDMLQAKQIERRQKQ